MIKNRYFCILNNMRLMKKYLVSIFMLFLGFGAFAQSVKHTVEPKETLYSISKKYNISFEELIRLNPEKKDGKLSIGDVLIIKSAPAASTKKYGEIIVEPKQTVYGIIKQYKISEAELKALNPNLTNDIKIGDKIILPLENIQKYSIPKTSEEIAYEAPKASVSQGSQDKFSSASTGAKTTSSAAISGNEYTIQPKDNYYKITNTFGLTKKQLLLLNPGLQKKGLVVGDVITVKGDLNLLAEQTAKSNKSKSKVKQVSEEKPKQSKVEYIQYTSVAGDTKYSIANKFGASVEDLLAANPSIVNYIKPGTSIKVRKIEPSKYIKTSEQPLNVAIILPLGLDTNNAKYRTLALDFVTGAKLAIQRKTDEGHKMSVKIIDAGAETLSDQSISELKEFNPDLIVGPFFKTSVLTVLDEFKDNKVPVVAPFANNEDMHNYSNLIVVETEEEVFADRIIKEVVDIYEEQKIYIVSDSQTNNANLIKDRLSKVLNNLNVQIVSSPQDIVLDKNMMTGQNVPVISILASDNDAMAKEYAGRIIQISKEVEDNKAFSMFYSTEFDKNIDALSKSSLVYIASRKINVDGGFEKEILAEYKKTYCKVPSKYAIVGFDVLNDMLSREMPSGNIFQNMDKIQTQLATKFEFVRAKEGGAYINVGYRVVRLLP